MNIVLFIIAWIILGIISVCITTGVAKRAIEENKGIETCSNDELVSTVNEMAETEKVESKINLKKMLKYSTLILIAGIIFWPVVMPLTLFGWNHYGEL